MTATNNMENELLLLYFNNTDHAGIGDASGLQNSATAGSLYVSLHTASPGEGGTQATNEAAYGSYARVAVARSGAGWTVTNDTVSNAAAITFPTASSGTETETHFGIGVDASGAGDLLFFGALTSNINVTASVTPSFATGELDVTVA